MRRNAAIVSGAFVVTLLVATVPAAALDCYAFVWDTGISVGNLVTAACFNVPPTQEFADLCGQAHALAGYWFDVGDYGA